MPFKSCERQGSDHRNPVAEGVDGVSQQEQPERPVVEQCPIPRGLCYLHFNRSLRLGDSS